MRFYNYLNESTNKKRFTKYFEGGEYKDLYIKSKKEVNFYNKDLELIGIKGQDGESITLLDINPKKGKINKRQKIDHYFVPVQYKTTIVYIDVNDIRTPQELSRGESLSIQATNLIKSGNNAVKNVILWGKEYSSSDFKEFTSDVELGNVIINGFKNNNSVPDYITNEMERIISGRNYVSFDWGSITSNDHKNQIGKYYGELLVGLCLLKGDYSVFRGNLQEMIKGQKIKSFLMPTSPSFPAADSLIKTDKKIIPISSKKGGGTGASFYTNLVPLLNNVDDKNLRSKTNILLQMKKIFNVVNKKNAVIRQIYEWGFNFLLKNIKNKLKNSPFDVYEIIRKDDLPNKNVDVIMNYIKNTRWKNIKNTHLKAVIDNLPYSLTHFFLYHQYYLLTNDEIAKDIILDILGAKEYWQADLQNNPWKNGNTVFKLKKSNETVLTFSPTRGKIDDIKSSHAKLNYILK